MFLLHVTLSEVHINERGSTSEPASRFSFPETCEDLTNAFSVTAMLSNSYSLYAPTFHKYIHIKYEMSVRQL